MLLKPSTSVQQATHNAISMTHESKQLRAYAIFQAVLKGRRTRGWVKRLHSAISYYHVDRDGGWRVKCVHMPITISPPEN